MPQKGHALSAATLLLDTKAFTATDPWRTLHWMSAFLFFLFSLRVKVCKRTFTLGCSQDVLSMEWHACCVVCPGFFCFYHYFVKCFPSGSREMGRVFSNIGPEQPLRPGARRIAGKGSSSGAVCGEFKSR